jgi:two-component system response regulator AtoC
MYQILIADDELAMLKGIQFNLQDNSDFEVFTASDRQSAIDILKSNEIDIVVSDLMMPDIADGLAVMKSAKEQWYKPSVLAMTAFETVENAVMAMQAGADDFISKGFGIDELSFRVENMLKKKQEVDYLANENRILRETIQQHYSDYKIVGRSKQIVDLHNRIQKIAADATATCLIQGESGTGKELIARAIHASSKRRDKPFVPINCAAIPENLIESELFGYEKGAFTSAYSTKPGKFENAKGGIIFLDEIGELPLSLQVRLLRVLEERSFYRIGGKRPIDIDVMILSASNKDLHEQVQKGLFREELYFRLDVIKIEVPPLRERKEDIKVLAQFFLDRFNKERKKDLKFSEQAMSMLESYDFPGNVRELRNIIEDAFVFCEGLTIQPHNLSLKTDVDKTSQPKNQESLFLSDNGDELLPFSQALEQFEKKYFTKLLRDSYWSIREAAKKAGLSREWLGKKLGKLGLKDV